MPGIEPQAATAIVMRALHWPDAFSDDDARLQSLAERWRPWRAYAAAHLRLDGFERLSAQPEPLTGASVSLRC
jgi:3-methyladenine DNA glycosylase/8-oxoguanine DNA glycosylase